MPRDQPAHASENQEHPITGTVSDLNVLVHDHKDQRFLRRVPTHADYSKF
jgi:hypothetical protein